MAATVLYTLLVVSFVFSTPGNSVPWKSLDDDEILDDYLEDYYQELNINVINDFPKSPLCPKGYKFNANGLKCEPVCVYGCENGKCTSPDVCHCEKGYEFVLNKCLPICSKRCKNGYCSAPDTCSCYFGTIWNDKLSSCVFSIQSRYKRSMYGYEFLYVQPWTTKQPVTKKPSKKSSPKLKVTIL